MSSKDAAEYERNVVFQGALSKRFYFAPKVRIMSPTVRLVVGKKYDITDHLQPFLLKRFRRKP